jgi:hypothetical protein
MLTSSVLMPHGSFEKGNGSSQRQLLHSPIFTSLDSALVIFFFCEWSLAMSPTPQLKGPSTWFPFNLFTTCRAMVEIF